MKKKQGLEYLRIDLTAIRELGANEAVLLALISAIVDATNEKDKDGFVGIETTYLAQQTGLGYKTVIRLRDKLVEARKIDFRPGLNQNRKGKYRLAGLDRFCSARKKSRRL